MDQISDALPSVSSTLPHTHSPGALQTLLHGECVSALLRHALTRRLADQVGERVPDKILNNKP